MTFSQSLLSLPLKHYFIQFKSVEGEVQMNESFPKPTALRLEADLMSPRAAFPPLGE